MNGARIPVITGTDAPSVEDLREHFVIALVQRSVASVGGVSLGYVGRLVLEQAGTVTLEDAFEYESIVEITGTREAPRVGRALRIFTVEGLAGPTITMRPLVLVPLSEEPPAVLEKLRACLVSAWEGRKFLRRAGARVELAGPGTSITPAR